VSRATLGHYLEGQGHSMTLQQNRVWSITLLFEVRFRNNFTEIIPILRRRVACLLPWRSRSQHDLSAKFFRPITLLFEVDLKTISHEWSPYWDDVSSATFRLLSWRSRSQQDLTAKLCPAQNFVIWGRILHFIYTNNHYDETTWRTLHLGRYLEGQCHSMTLQHNCVRPITLLFEVLFKNYFT